jgi:menaquinone reductase, iron-sulfur cluster-binding subunit
MARWGMVIDLDRCNGCQACAVACRAENNVPSGGPDVAGIGRTIHWMEVVSQVQGDYPNVKMRYVPMPCMHCDEPPCIKVCPVGATYLNPEGLVAQIYNRCVGCRYCTVACPYTRRFFNWFEPSWPEVQERQLNPEVSVRPKGVVEKCSFCSHRLRLAKDAARREDRTELRDDEVRKLPACCQTCPTGAMVFGDLDDPESTVSKLAHGPRAFQLLEDLGTHPKVYYLRERDRQ